MGHIRTVEVIDGKGTGSWIWNWIQCVVSEFGTINFWGDVGGIGVGRASNSFTSIKLKFPLFIRRKSPCS